MKKFVITIYGYNDDLMKSYALESLLDNVAVFRALRKHDKEFADAYRGFLSETGSDLGNVSDIREFCHDVYKISVLEF